MSVRSELRLERLEADNHQCRWPSVGHQGPLEMAHLTQLSQGGSDTVDNVVMLCRWHHDVLDNRAILKGRRTAIMELLKEYLDWVDGSFPMGGSG